MSMIRYLYPGEAGQLEKQKKNSPNLHDHHFEKTFMMNPGIGWFNPSVYDTCFGCGEMRKIEMVSESLAREISEIVRQKAEASNKSYGELDSSDTANASQVNEVVHLPYGSGVSCVFFTVLIKSGSVINKYPGGFEALARKHAGIETDGQLLSLVSMGSDHGPIIEDLENKGLVSNDKEVDFYLYCEDEERRNISVESLPKLLLTTDDGAIEFFFRGEGKDRRIWVKLKIQESLDDDEDGGVTWAMHNRIPSSKFQP